MWRRPVSTGLRRQRGDSGGRYAGSEQRKLYSARALLRRRKKGRTRSGPEVGWWAPGYADSRKETKGARCHAGAGSSRFRRRRPVFLFVCFFNICFYKLAKERVGLWHVEETGFLRLQKEWLERTPLRGRCQKNEAERGIGGERLGRAQTGMPHPFLWATALREHRELTQGKPATRRSGPKWERLGTMFSFTCSANGGTWIFQKFFRCSRLRCSIRRGKKKNHKRNASQWTRIIHFSFSDKLVYSLWH